jgi:hypothetical protein
MKLDTVMTWQTQPKASYDGRKNYFTDTSRVIPKEPRQFRACLAGIASQKQPCHRHQETSAIILQTFALISECSVNPSGVGKVLYLTVHESHCEQGQSQRRSGLHVKAPGSFQKEASFATAVEHRWG